MIALDFHSPVFCRAARTATLFKVAGDGQDLAFVQPGHDRDDARSATFAPHAHDAVLGNRIVLFHMPSLEFCEGPSSAIRETGAMIVLTVTYVIRSGRVDEAREHFIAMRDATRNEPGNRAYFVHQSVEEPQQFFLYEQYDDSAAQDEHRASAHFEEHIRSGVMQIMESRTPQTYRLLE